MTAPRVGFEGFSKLSTHRIEVNVLEKPEQVSLSVAQDGFIPSLEKMANGPVSAIIVHSIGLVQPLHKF